MNATHTEPIPNPLRQQAGFVMPAALEAEADELITHYPEKRAASLMVLHAIQEQFGWISQEARRVDGEETGFAAHQRL